MAKSSVQSKRPGPAWFTKRELAAVFDVNASGFDANYRRYASAEATKDVDGVLFFHARKLLEAWKVAVGPGRPSTTTDPLLVGGDDSPALEEYRKARARLAWMEVDEREKTHVPLAELVPTLLQLTGLLRRAGDRLARSHGNDAAAVLNEAVDQWEMSIESLLKHDPDTAPAEAHS